jgi:CAAX prenyl protease-like protein
LRHDASIDRRNQKSKSNPDSHKYLTPSTLAHAYQGFRGILITGIIGILFAAVVLAFDSLPAAIAIHAVLDITHGILAWLIVRQTPDDGHAASA